jgi:hypothetical protein
MSLSSSGPAFPDLWLDDAVKTGAFGGPLLPAAVGYRPLRLASPPSSPSRAKR